MKKILPAFLLASLMSVVFSSTSLAQPTPYTNSVDFFNAITSSNYTENFNSLSGGTTNSSPLNFSNNGFQYVDLGLFIF
jgi:hypothetical protein